MPAFRVLHIGPKAVELKSIKHTKQGAKSSATENFEMEKVLQELLPQFHIRGEGLNLN